MMRDPLERLLGGIDRPLAPRPEFAEALLDRLLSELEQGAATERTPNEPSQEEGLLIDASASVPATIGPATSWSGVPLAGRSRWRFWRGHALTQLATAALVVLALGVSFIAVAPHWPGRQDGAPVFIAAPSGLSATPAPAAGPLAEALWHADGGPDFPFGHPKGLVIGPGGNVWVADGHNARFVVFLPDGEVLEAWGTPGSGEGEFDFTCSSAPAAGLSFGAVAFDADGNIYVADAGNKRIQKFAPDRTFLMSWASAGPANEPFGCPGAIAVDRQGRVYVGGEHWGRVEVFDADGTWLATWPDLKNPAGITVDGDGTIWIADSGGQVVKFSADGKRLSSWKGDVGYIEADGVAVDAQGRVFVTDFAHRVVVFAPDGTVLGSWGERGDAPGEFRTPWGIALDGQGAVYISDMYGQRIQKFRLLPPLGPG